jgi:hypothetical protein
LFSRQDEGHRRTAQEDTMTTTTARTARTLVRRLAGIIVATVTV